MLEKRWGHSSQDLGWIFHFFFRINLLVKFYIKLCPYVLIVAVQIFLLVLPNRVPAPKPWTISMETYGFKDVSTILLFPSVLRRRTAMSKVLAQSLSGFQNLRVASVPTQTPPPPKKRRYAPALTSHQNLGFQPRFRIQFFLLKFGEGPLAAACRDELGPVVVHFGSRAEGRRFNSARRRLQWAGVKFHRFV